MSRKLSNIQLETNYLENTSFFIKEISERNKCVDELAQLKENTLRRSNCEVERKSLNELNKNYRAYQEKCKNDYKNLQIRYDNIKNTVCPPCDTDKNSLNGIK